MPKDLTPEELQAIAKELSINTPIMSYRVVGDRVEIHLLGGRQLIYNRSMTVDIPSLLAVLTVKELRQLAKDLEVPGFSRKNKKALIKALSELDPNQVEYALALLNY